VMGITLCGLACGYFLGGRISTKKNPEKKLMYVLIAAGIFMMVMPLLSRFMNYFAFHLSLLPAVSVSSLFVLFPPLFFMGMVSPLVIHCLISEKKGGGKRSGEVYAVSTAGGILFTFLTGFWLLPSFGISNPLLFLGAILILIPLIYLVKFKNTLQAFILFAFTGLVFYTHIKNLQKKEYVLFESEGILGKVEVVDFERKNPATGKNEHPRYLLVNNIIQSSIDMNDRNFFQDYTGAIDSNITENGKGKKVLVLGLGGGIVAGIFNRKGYEVKTVELDERIYKTARDYFFLEKDIQVIIDDARHYVNIMTEKFDYIMIDVFRGEDPPYYVLTKESITKMKNSLTENGIIIVNTYGYLNSVTGKGNRALIKTFRDCSMNVEISGTGPTEETRNLLLYATSIKTINKTDSLSSKKITGLIKEAFSLDDVAVLTDKNCPLDFLNAEAGVHWRHLYIKNFILARQ
ncbi:MAG: fused MFS/spermidine synthase, partial [Bacteroidia bacterium]|nr:fused MFS/spermidine synthase [Bacteroidia bacterium]